MGQSFKFGLNDCKVAVWNSASSWGTPVDVESVQVMGIQLQTVNGTLNGDDAITDTFARAISAQITMRWGFKDFAVISVLTGIAQNSSDGDYSWIASNDKMPYIGLAGKVDDSEGSANDVWFVPKAKLMEGFAIRMEYGQYVIPEITLMAVKNDATYGIFGGWQYAAATPIAFPPTAIGA